MNPEITAKPTPNITELPPELLENILAHVETAQALSHLSQTCKGLHAFVEKDGYRIFVQNRFPSISIPPPGIDCSDDAVADIRNTPKFWKDAAHGTTTLSRNWDRRAFIAQIIGDPESKHKDNAVENARRRRRFGQSMGFHPVIDSYESWYGGDWASRKEVVAWGAGARLIMRSRLIGKEASDDGERPSYGHKVHWRTYSSQGAQEGRDDITALNLIPQRLGEAEEITLGRANGDLERICLDEESGNQILATYDTNGLPVRYTTTHHRSGLVAACLSDETVALYPLNQPGRDVQAYARTSLQCPFGTVRTWSNKFLHEGRLAIGFGRSNRPINIFNLGQGSAKLEHAVSLDLERGATGDRPNGAGAAPHGTSVYAIAPLSPSLTSSGGEGDVFLSGAYDGNVRLHDLRLSTTVVSLFSDSVDQSAIYSLVPIGRERFVAGGASHSLLKVFDLRMPGQKIYHAADLLPCSPCSPQQSLCMDRREQSQFEAKAANLCRNGRRCVFHTSIHSPRNWNVFLGTRNHGQDQSVESPVYALSRPSSVSSSIFAGVQNRIIQLDIISVLDQHPDPIYGSGPSYSGPFHTGRSSSDETSDARRMAQEREMDAGAERWDPEQEVMSLPMYEQAEQVVLRHQQPVRATCSGVERGVSFHGLDERWGGSSVKEQGRWRDNKKRER